MRVMLNVAVAVTALMSTVVEAHEVSVAVFEPEYSTSFLSANSVSSAMRNAMSSPDRAGAGAEFGCLESRYHPTWWLKPSVELRRATYYPIMTQVACEFGIPVDLMDAVVAHESGYNPNVISRAGAMGMMQIMPETARSLGLAFPWDPVANMRAGARYLRNQIYRFGRMDLALAAYNAGPERKSLNAGYIPAIPETLGYVRTITTNWTRLAAYTPDLTAAAARASAATVAVRTAGYREVDLLIYYGINAANPI